MPPSHATPVSLARRGLSGFFFSGLTFAFPGTILVVWRYHMAPNYLIIGSYFLCQVLGIVAGAWLGNLLLRRKGIAFTLSASSLAVCVVLLLLAACSLPVAFWWRMGALLLLGMTCGALNASSLHALTPAYDLHPASTMNLAGLVFGFGSFVCALFLSGTFFVYTVPSILILMAVAPGMASGVYWRAQMPAEPVRPERGWRETLRDFKNPTAVLLALLLFFHIGNEGALAGWLALFLTERLGASPSTSLFLVALYWFALTVGRLVTQWVLPRVSHGRLLLAAVSGPMLACLILFATNNLFGATTGVLLAGGGFSAILPLVMEKIGDRFPEYHPGFFHGIFSLALAGGLLSSASLGLFAHWWGIRIVMGLPLAGSIMVLLLVMLILLESRLSSKPA